MTTKKAWAIRGVARGGEEVWLGSEVAPGHWGVWDADVIERWGSIFARSTYTGMNKLTLDNAALIAEPAGSVLDDGTIEAVEIDVPMTRKELEAEVSMLRAKCATHSR